jgi:hypothetical protein
MEWPDRTTFIAVKGHRQRLFTSPATDAAIERNRPERPKHLQPIRDPAHATVRLLRRIARGARRRLFGRS